MGFSPELIPLFTGSFTGRFTSSFIPVHMSQTPYTFEYEIKASPKVLYPYLSSPSGLQQWFADKVIVRGSSELHFYWDNENHPALVLPGKANKSVKFDFKRGDRSQLELLRSTFDDFRLFFYVHTEEACYIIK